MNDSFWTGGAEAQEDGLRAWFKSELKELKRRRDDAANQDDRAKIESDTQQLKSDFARDLQAINDSLF